MNIYEQTKKNIHKYGWSTVGVFPDEEREEPGFTYSIGFEEKYLHPDVIIVGLTSEVSHQLINTMKNMIENGVQFRTDKIYDDIANLPCAFVEVSQANIDKYMCQADVYYSQIDMKFKALQLIWADTLGTLPFEEGYEERFIHAQPMLNQ